MTSVLIDMAVDERRLSKLRALPGVNVEVVPENTAPHDFPERLIRGVDVLFCHLPPLNHAVMERLKFIQLASSGFTQAIGQGFSGRGIRVSNASGVFDTAIAEWNVAMMINLLRDMRGMMRNQEAGIWDRSVRFQRELRGCVAGIWGYGGIGRETTRLLKAMGVAVRVMTRRGVRVRGQQYALPGTGDPQGLLPDESYVPGQEQAFLGGLDFLILALPLSPQSQGIVGAEELAMLPATAWILNPARGPLIREEALLAALRGGKLAGAALDTHYVYPMPADHPLWRFPNVIMTSHISGSTGNPHYLPRVWDLFTQNVKRLQAGDPLLNALSAADLQ